MLHTYVKAIDISGTSPNLFLGKHLAQAVVFVQAPDPSCVHIKANSVIRWLCLNTSGCSWLAWFNSNNEPALPGLREIAIWYQKNGTEQDEKRDKQDEIVFENIFETSFMNDR